MESCTQDVDFHTSCNRAANRSLRHQVAVHRLSDHPEDQVPAGEYNRVLSQNGK